MCVRVCVCVVTRIINVNRFICMENEMPDVCVCVPRLCFEISGITGILSVSCKIFARI